MSMKSMTMRPPISRMRSCRAISSAASRLVLVAVVSMSLPRVARATGRLDRLPLSREIVEVPLQLRGRAADARGAHDRAHAVRDLQLAHHLAHLIAILALDAARDPAGARVVRHQHEEAPGEADERGERRPLGAALLLLHLHDDFLALGQELADVHPRALGLLAEAFLGDLLQRQESMALGAVLDEAGLERGLDAGDPGLVDVGFLLLAGR